MDVSAAALITLGFVKVVAAAVGVLTRLVMAAAVSAPSPIRGDPVFVMTSRSSPSRSSVSHRSGNMHGPRRVKNDTTRQDGIPVFFVASGGYLDHGTAGLLVQHEPKER